MSAHTPAPWNNRPRQECIPICKQDEAGLSIGFVHSSDPSRTAEGLANAYLIASAPELLAAVEICLKAEQERRKKLLPGAPATTYCERRIALIEAAIAKARGEQ